MRQEMYSNIIGRMVWEKYQKAPIWQNDFYAQIEVKDNSLFDRLDIQYDDSLEDGEIKYVRIVKYVDVAGGLGESYDYLIDMSMNEQKAIYDIIEKEI